VADEPVPGQPGYLLKGAWSGEKVRGARDDLQACLARQLAQRFPVELDDHGVQCPDDQQGRLADRPQVRACEVGAATTRDDRCYEPGRAAAATSAAAALVLAPNSPTGRPAVGR